MRELKEIKPSLRRGPKSLNYLKKGRPPKEQRKK
jgi:hypothetical protein